MGLAFIVREIVSVGPRRTLCGIELNYGNNRLRPDIFVVHGRFFGLGHNHGRLLISFDNKVMDGHYSLGLAPACNTIQ
jgi:hypothetical protein